MINPTLEELSAGGKYNRYMLVIATSKCARIVTDEYVEQRENAEKAIQSKDNDKSLASFIKKEYRDEKAVKNAINRLVSGEFRIVSPEETAARKAAEEAAREAELSAAEEEQDPGDETAEGEPDTGADA